MPASASPCRAAIPRSASAKRPRRRKSSAARSGSSRRRSTPAAAARAAASSWRARRPRSRQLAGQILGMQLVTHQTGPQGQKVRRLLIEEGADIKKEYYVAVLTDRATQKVAMMGSSEGGMDIEKVAHDTPEKILKVFVDPIDGPGRRRRPPSSPPASASRRKPRPQAIDVLQEALRLLHGNRRLAGRDQSADPRGRQERRADDDQGARRQVQLRLERDLPPSRDRRLPRPRRGRPGRDRGEQVRPRLHPARRQHRLPGQRRRPGDGDDGHDQAVRRLAGELPRRRRRRLGREGHRGVQDHARRTRR